MKKGAKTKTKKTTKNTIKKTTNKKEEKPIKKKAVSTKKKAVKKVKRARKPSKKELKLEQEQHIKDIEKEIERAVKVERDKRMILWTGVTFFMAVIFIFWIFNIKSTFKKIENENVNKDSIEWNEVSDNLDKAMSEMKENLAEIKEFTGASDKVGTSTDKEAEKVVNDIFSEREEIEVLREKLKELEGKLSTSSPDNILE